MKVTKKTVQTVTVNLQLTEHEASILQSILECIGGEPNGPRGECDAIYNGLLELNLRPDNTFDVSGNFRVEKA